MKKRVLLLILICGCLVPAAAGCLDMPQKTPLVPTPSATVSPSPMATLEPVRITRPEALGEDTSPAAYITRRYTWEYAGREWSMELQVAEDLYSYYKEIPRPPTTNYSVYVTHPLDDAEVGVLADELRAAAGQRRFSEVEQVEFAAAFVQSLPYTEDTVTTTYDEYPRYPVETLVDNGGDCEDTSILLAAILDSLGYNVALIIFPDEHAAVGVAVDGVAGSYYELSGTGYFYLETTNTGWGIGQVPDEIQGLSARIYDMTPAPILTHEWEGSITGTVAELEITVNNLGSGVAGGVYILTGFDAGEGRLWNAEESQPFDLGLDQTATVRITLKVPPEKHTRITVQVVYDGVAVDESYSEWFDTTGY